MLSGGKGRGDYGPVSSSTSVPGSLVVIVKSLPATCKEDELIEFLSDYDVEEVLMASKPGQALARFTSVQEAQRAVRKKNRAEIGGHNAELIQVDPKLWDQVLKPGEAGLDASAGGSSQGAGMSTLKLRGLPFWCQAADVASFMAAYQVTADRVAISSRPGDNAPSGEAFVAFDDAEFAEQALYELQRQNLGGRYIELFQATYEDFQWALSNPPTIDESKGKKGKGKGKDGKDKGKDSGGKGMSEKGKGKLGKLCGDDPVKIDLVMRIKQMQKESEDSKEVWWKYCAEHGDNVRDPVRHKVEYLKGFLEGYEAAASSMQQQE